MLVMGGNGCMYLRLYSLSHRVFIPDFISPPPLLWSMSVPMTLSDLERWDLRSTFSPTDLRTIPFDLERPNVACYHMGERHICKGSAMPPSHEQCCSIPKIFRTLIYTHTAWATATKFCTAMCENRHISRGSNTTLIQWAGPQSLQFLDLLHTSTKYDKQKPNFAW